MEKMKMESQDMTANNIEYIASKFPNCITESKDESGKTKKAINFELLKQMLSSDIVDGDEAYEFTWVGKKASIVEANKPIRKTLRPCPEESVDWDNTENLYIEGDNLEVLKLLQESYLGKVKMIYIDPPYNTGNDFIYNDDFKMTSEEYADESGSFDENGNRLYRNTDSNGRFHSDWCSMMYSRLLIARNLLSDDGLIFISIDDNEQENLKKICDDVFGSENHIETIVWKNKYGAGAFTVGFISVHEYIFCYSKQKISNITSELDDEGIKMYSKSDEKYSTRGGYMTQPLMTNSLGDRPNLMYSIEYNGDTIVPRKQWVWERTKLLAAIEKGEVEFNKQADGTYSVRSKSYLKDENGNMRRGKPLSLFNGPFNQEGTKDIRDLFGGKSIFDFTKPSALIKKLISLQINNKEDTDYIVMDFFSGSATTAQAVMEQNAQENGKRKFIMVQMPESTSVSSLAKKEGFNTICEIGKERIRRASKKIREEYPNAIFDSGFRVLKLDESNMTDVYYPATEYKQEDLSLFESNIKEDRTDLDLLFGCLLEWGLSLSLPHKSEDIDGFMVHTYNNGDLIACFDENITDEVIKTIAKRKPIRAVFRDSSFASSPAKINVEEIFKLLAPDARVKVI